MPILYEAVSSTESTPIITLSRLANDSGLESGWTKLPI
jgi:hypothetical protein